MKRLLFLVLLLIHASIFTGQEKFSKTYGDVSKAELRMQQYPDDKDADAVVLYDLGKSQMINQDGQFSIVYERTTRIKILTDAGIKQADIVIPYHVQKNDGEFVSKIEGCTYNLENGEITKTELNPKNIYNERKGKYTHVRKFAMPNVKKGSVIEYKYRLTSPYIFKLKTWNFQWRIPVDFSEYIVRVNPFYEYSWILQGARNFDYYNTFVDNTTHRFGSTTYRNVVYDMTMTHIPAFKDENYITSIKDYVKKVDFQLSKIHYPTGGTKEISTTWPKMVSELLKEDDFGKFLKKSGKLSSKLVDIKSLSKKSERVRFNTIMDFIKAHFTWNEDNGYYANVKADKFVDNKSGNDAEINLFTTALLNEAGIEAYPVIISTRDHGTIKYNYPYAHFFNYVVIMAKVDGKLLLCDATERFAQNDRLPPRCINDKGLIIKKGEARWVNLQNNHPSEIFVDNTISSDNDQLKAQVTKIATENFALYYRQKYTHKKDKLKKQLESKDYTLVDTSILVLNPDKKRKPYILKYSFNADRAEMNGKLYITPFFNEVISDNPLKQNRRSYPIDMVYPEKRGFKSIITIPKGYKVDYLPKPLTIHDKLFDMTYKILHDQGKILVSLQYYFKKGVYPATDYSKLKYFFSKIVNKGNEKVVLVKKSLANH